MEKLKKRLLQADIEQDVREIEKEIASHPELDQIQVTEEMDAALLSKIQEYEKEKAEEEAIRGDRAKEFKKRANEIKVPDLEISEELVPDIGAVSKVNVVSETGDAVVVKYKKKRVRWIMVLASVLVLALAFGMTSVGSKSYWKELLDVFMGDESARVINVEDMDKQRTEDVDEILVYQEISQKFGHAAVHMRYKPNAMELERYELDEDMQIARIFFKYKDGIVRYSIYASQEDSSWTEKEEDVITKEYTKEVKGVEIEVDEISKSNQKVKTRVAKFEYEGIHYELKGEIEGKEFEKILENLYFL